MTQIFHEEEEEEEEENFHNAEKCSMGTLKVQKRFLTESIK